MYEGIGIRKCMNSFKLLKRKFSLVFWMKCDFYEKTARNNGFRCKKFLNTLLMRKVMQKFYWTHERCKKFLKHTSITKNYQSNLKINKWCKKITKRKYDSKKTQKLLNALMMLKLKLTSHYYPEMIKLLQSLLSKKNQNYKTEAKRQKITKSVKTISSREIHSI